ncbi:uncharacterized protein IWZ02DRAFT_60271 [Phyllosticta citriasiana]|uniref:uncharacterized protein n=1 Tax=Phyllosticta citriasiana TaxID=595635 RepID=UPI0030FD4A67
MAFPKLTPLQSRLAASLTALIVLIIIYMSMYPRNFASAAELESNLDHNHQRIHEARGVIDDDLLRQHEVLEGLVRSAWDDMDDEDKYPHAAYEPEFVVGVSKELVGRADTTSTGAEATLEGNTPAATTVSAGKTQTFRFANESVWGNYSQYMPTLPTIASREIVARNLDRELKRRDAHPGAEDVGQRAEWDDDELATPTRRQTADTRIVYISMNVCSGPAVNGTTTAAPPQLTMYVSTSNDNDSPGPNSDGEQAVLPLTGGFAGATVIATSNVYVSVHAPSPLPDGYSGDWDYEVAASIDAPYHAYNDRDPTEAFAYFVDSDTTSALIVTDNLTTTKTGSDDYKAWMQAVDPFYVYTFNRNITAINGLERSYCALRNAQAQAPTAVLTGMTTRGLGNKPKQQFFVQNLNGSTSYEAFPVMQGNSTASGAGVVGGGGQVWPVVGFTTKSDNNCQIIFNLTFCDEVSYAVPSNPDRFSGMEPLRDLYDNHAMSIYQNFDYTLQQTACNTTTTAQYSLAKNCTDCAKSYKNWLCAVTIPRCEDFSASDKWLQPRNVASPFINGTTIAETPFADNVKEYNSTLRNRLYANSSRNSLIDTVVQPGPYKELLPCDDLCYSLVQSCPATMSFACPLKGKGLEQSYGTRDGNGGGTLTCSYLGAIFYVNTAGSLWGGAVVLKSFVFAALAAGWMVWV